MLYLGLIVLMMSCHVTHDKLLCSYKIYDKLKQDSIALLTNGAYVKLVIATINLNYCM